MKRLLRLAGAVFLAFLPSCGLRVLEEDFQADLLGPGEIEFTADFGESGDDTRTVLEGTKVHWMPHDELSMFYGSGDEGGMKFTGTNDVIAHVATFRGTIDVVTGGNDIADEDLYFWGLYPYDPEASLDRMLVTTSLRPVQTAKAGSFEDDLAISIGRSKGLRMSFRNVCGMLKFTISEEGMRMVKFRSNGGEMLAGRFSFGMDSDNLPYVAGVFDGSDCITLLPPEGQDYFTPGDDYYIVCLPATLSKGFTLTMFKSIQELDTDIYTVESLTRVSVRTNSIRRSVVSGLGCVDQGYADKWQKHAFVNLGIADADGNPVFFADRNIGAESIVSRGGKFAWAEASERDASTLPFTTANAPYYLGMDPEGVYPCYSYYGLGDMLDPLDDAAAQLWGGCWEVPSYKDFDAVDRDRVFWVDWYGANLTGLDPGSNGIMIHGKGNITGFVFLPVTGLGYRDASAMYGSTDGFYWTSVSDDETGRGACYLHFSKDSSNSADENYRLGTYGRYAGMAVRPVWKGSVSDFRHLTGGLMPLLYP